MFTTRSYANQGDLQQMRMLVMQSQSALDRFAYLHPGDIVWRVWDTLLAYEPAQVVQLWEDAQGALVAFALIYPLYAGFDLLVHPQYQGTGFEDQALAWTEQRTRELMAAEGQTVGSVDAWDVFEGDRGRITLLEHQGYVRRDDVYIYAMRSLDEALLVPTLPPDFSIRGLLDPADVAERIAHRPDLTVEHYVQFRQAPGYDAELDLVVVAPDGRFGAYCICWLDPDNKIGLFEPVGTRQAFRRQGLARAVLHAGFQCIKSRGMTTAAVCYDAANGAAARLYASVGFTPHSTIYTYHKAG